MNGNKKINNLKKLVVIISIAILVVAVILVMSIYRNIFNPGGWGKSEAGRSTVETTKFTDIIIDPDTGETVTTESTTTSSSSETTSSAPTETPTTNAAPQTSVKTTRSRVTNPTVAPTEPPSKYTIVTSGGSGYSNSNSSLEWALLNEINSRRSNQLQMASELRNQAENSANSAVNSYATSISQGYCQKPNDPNCLCQFGEVKFDGAVYCVWYNRSIVEVADRLIGSNGGILDEDYKYAGVGVVLKDGNYSFTVIVD